MYSRYRTLSSIIHLPVKSSYKITLSETPVDVSADMNALSLLGSPCMGSHYLKRQTKITNMQ